MRTNSIHLFFLGLALLFWNPFTFYLFYKSTLIFQYKGFLIFYTIVFVFGLMLAYIIRKNRISEKLKNLILSACIVGILFGLLTLINKLIGGDAELEKEGLIFVPGTEVLYKSLEFDYKVSINSVGLRDHEFNINKGNKFRIVCVGDSWTIGWGVSLEDSYPKQLENYLRSKGKNVEVINCGQAGANTSIYPKHLRKILPLLKPDLVLLGLLQGDDLAQLYEMDSVFKPAPIKPVTMFHQIKSCAKEYLSASAGNIISMFKPRKPISIQDNWQASATSVLSSLTDEQNIKFKALQDTVQQFFRTGNLNPSLIRFYLDFPDRVFKFNNPNHPATQIAIRKMQNDISQIKSVCDSNNTRLILVSMPTNEFTGHEVIKTKSDTLNSYIEKNNKVDSVYHALALENKLPYLQLTEHFIALTDKRAYFYRFDGHPTARGYEEIAQFIGNHIQDRLP